MKLHTNSWYGRLYASTYGKNNASELPKDICSFFWPLLFALVTFPLCWPGHVINLLTPKSMNRTNALVTVLHIPMAFFFGIIISLARGQKEGNLLSFYLWGFLGLTFFLLFVFAIAAGCFYVTDKIRNRRALTPKKVNPLVAGFKAFKGKYCTPISWERK